MRHILTASFLVFAIAGLAGAQTFRGGISGVVLDATSATVPGADVKATN
jgi:hypothetical protein